MQDRDIIIINPCNNSNFFPPNFLLSMMAYSCGYTILLATALCFYIAMLGTDCSWVAHVIKLLVIDTMITCIVIYGVNQFCTHNHYKHLF